jgi:hypothetical protein
MIERPGGVLLEPGRILILAEPPSGVLNPEQAAAVAMQCSLREFGPVLAVTDLGDAWRIFRAKRPDWLDPLYVPWLVFKATGDLVVEWPLREDGPTAQERMQELLRLIDPHLRAMGFAGASGPGPSRRRRM